MKTCIQIHQHPDKNYLIYLAEIQFDNLDPCANNAR